MTWSHPTVAGPHCICGRGAQPFPFADDRCRLGGDQKDLCERLAREGEHVLIDQEFAPIS